MEMSSQARTSVIYNEMQGNPTVFGIGVVFKQTLMSQLQI